MQIEYFDPYMKIKGKIHTVKHESVGTLNFQNAFLMLTKNIYKKKRKKSGKKRPIIKYISVKSVHLEVGKIKVIFTIDA